VPIEAELRIVNAAGAPGVGAPTAAGGLGGDKEIRDSLKDMARFFRRPEQIFGGGSAGLLGLAGRAVGVALGPELLALIAGAGVLTGALKKLSGDILEKFGVDPRGVIQPDTVSTVDPGTGIITPGAPSPFTFRQPSKPRTGVGTDPLRAPLPPGTKTGFLPLESFSLNQEVLRVQEEFSRILNDNIDDSEQVNELLTLSLGLADQRTFAEEELVDNQLKGIRVTQDSIDIIGESGILIKSIGVLIQEETTFREQQIIKEVSLNSTLVDRIRLLKKIRDLEGRTSRKIASVGRSPLSGVLTTTSVGSFGVGGAGGNASILREFGSPEAQTATGR